MVRLFKRRYGSELRVPSGSHKWFDSDPRLRLFVRGSCLLSEDIRWACMLQLSVIAWIYRRLKGANVVAMWDEDARPLQ